MLNPYKAVFEESSVPKLIIDYKSYQIITSNKAARNIFDLKNSRTKDSYLYEFLSPDNKEEFLGQLKKLKVKKYSSIEFVKLLTKKTGGEIFNLDLTQIKAEGTKKILCDFIKPKESASEINNTLFYDQLFHLALNPFIITDDKYRLVYCNKAAEKLFNKKASLITG